MYVLVKEIRNKTVSELGEILKSKIEDFDYTLESGISNFRLHGMNYKFVKYLLCRITGYFEQQVGLDSSFKKFFHPTGKRYEVERQIKDRSAFWRPCPSNRELDHFGHARKCRIQYIKTQIS